MIQPGERVAREALLDQVAAYIRFKLALLYDEIRIGSIELAQLGLIALAIALQTLVVLTPGHFRPTPIPYYAWQVVLGSFASLAIALIATLNFKRFLGIRIRRLLCCFALVAICGLPLVAFFVASPGALRMLNGAPYGNDGAMMDQYAAGQVLQARNPYVATNVVTALASINAPCTTTTPLMDGQFRGARSYPSEAAVQQACYNVLHFRPRTIPPEFESKYNYPAGAFLLILPFVWAGLHDVRLLYFLAIVAIGVYLWFQTSRSLRLLIPLLFLANVPLVLNVIGGQPDPIYALCLLLGFAEWRARRLSPLAMGLSVATKQLAWFYVPFYLVVVGRNLGWRECARRVGIMSLVFLALNGPFIAQSPGAYIASISAPMADPMFPIGMGIVALFSSTVLPMIPKVAFTVMEGFTWLAGTLATLRLHILTPASCAVLAVVPLFFAWRSLDNYFYLVPFIALAIALRERRQGQRMEA
jgi:hypothetical protein